MHAIETTIPTNEASRYLQQLCKHWSHRLKVTFTPETGYVAFDDDSACLMTADGEGLALRIETTDASKAARLAQVVFEHLQRFSFRNPLPQASWTEGAEA
jgi:hypothetical protein